MITLIGSRAIKQWFPDFREPVGDWDWLSDGARMGNIPYVREDEKNDLLADERLAAWPWGTVATPNELYTLKISHMFWEIGGRTENWNKHAYDAIFLQRHGCHFMRELYDIVLPIWREKHRKNPVKLAGASKDRFFADAVVRKYDHDSLHRSVAYDSRPMYELILKDDSEVDCCWEKFQELCHEDKIWLCREEVYVTALERILVPAWDQGRKPSPRQAYHWALRRTITSLFKGEWALYMALNLDELFRPDVDYVARHLSRADLLEVTNV